MKQLILSRELPAKVVRVLLVFALVFWMSFRVECLAFAQISTDQLSAHSGETLTNVEVWQVSHLDRNDKSVLEKKAHDAKGTAKGDEQPNVLRVGKGGELQFVSLASWKAAEGEGGQSSGQSEEPSSGASSGSSGSSENPGGDTGGNTGGDTGGDTGGNTGGDTGGDTGGNTGGDTGGNTGGDTGGDTGGNTGGDTGGNTGGDTGGNTGGDTGGNTGGDTGGDTGGNTGGDTGGNTGGDTGGAEGGDNAGTEVTTTSADVTTRPAPSPNDDPSSNDLVIADFMKWEVEGDCAEISERDGVATLVGKAPGIATVRCYPNENAAERVDSGFSGTFEVKFNVQVVYVSSLELYSVATGERVGTTSDPLVLEDDQKEGYAFKARANVSTGNEADGTEGFESTSETPLSSASNNLLHDLRWEVFDEKGAAVGEDVATITEGGVLTLKGEGPIVVRCTTPDGLNGNYSESVTVKTGKTKEKEDVQGASHPQDTLTVVVQKPKVEVETANGEKSDQAASGDSASSSSASAEAAQVEETTTQYTKDLVNQATGKQLDVSDEKTYSMTLDEKARTVSGRGTTLGLLLDDAGVTLEDQKSIESIEFVNVFETHTTIPWSDLVSVSHSEGTDIMVAKQAYVHEPQDSEESSEAQSGSSEAAAETQPAASEGTEEPQTRPAPSPNGGTTVQTMDEENGTVGDEGTQTETPATEGPTNTDTGGTDAGGTETGGNDTAGTDTGGTDTGGTETGGNDTAGTDTAGTDAGGAGTGSTDQGTSGNTEGASSNTFLDNTRFQILFDQPQGGGGINASDLRWVHTVIVHMKGAEPAPKLIGELKPTIDYTPVPEGMVAFLTAVPPTAIGSTTFGYKWERSKDEGKTWKQVGSDTQQTIQVTTDSEHIGSWYRVSVITDSGLSEPSDHVVIKPGSGLSVQLDYIPPIAGDWANFTSHVIGPNGGEINDSSIEYKWQQSTDGGSSWQDIPNEKGKTLSVKTNPVSSGGSGGGDTSLTYIRVVAVYNSESLISNRQLLTVRVGESDGHSSEETGKDEKTNAIENAMNGGSANQTPDNATPANTSDQGNVKVTAIDITPGADFADEDTDDDDLEEGYFDDAEEATEQKPDQERQEKPKETTDVTDVVVDKRVSEIIMEQNNKDAQNKAATPGARWTEISAVNASQDDIRRVLAGNPFAPLAAPFALGITAAGLVEKLIAFRRQIF